MQIKNIISFFFLFQSIISTPRRNHVEAVEAVEVEIHHDKRSPRRNRNHVEAIEAVEVEIHHREDLAKRATKPQQRKGKLGLDTVPVVEGVLA